MSVLVDEPCEACGLPFPPIDREGVERAECRNRAHLDAGVMCNECGTCLHGSHRREAQ